jgi:HTH-type transcriptional regulator/antitoxin HipB
MDTARDAKHLGNIISRARKQAGWNQTVLAAKANLGQDTVSLIETGKPARLDSILAILAALDLEIRVAPRTKGRASDIEDIF